ncbi:peptidoglycan/LPS O-acetylase OafA/YrhL [Cellulomonas sp. PhB143]|nr:peptidoglycan/LPS O-acetylase OafA/YrhL [Cellulomonas sp. PhB143]
MQAPPAPGRTTSKAPLPEVSPDLPPPSAPVPGAGRPRLHALDGLRFVAASAVLLYHFTGTGQDYWGGTPSTAFPNVNEVSRYGFLGVEVFFVISGFAILLTAYDRPLRGFVASRVGRLFPAYWVAIGLTVLLQAVWSGGRAPSALDTVLNLTMMQDPFGATSVQVVFWTLLVELKFYLLMGLLVAVGVTRERVIGLAVLWPLLGQLAKDSGSDLVTTLLVPDYAPYFAVGMLLYLVVRDGNDAAVWLGIGLNLLLCVRLLTRYSVHASDITGEPVRAGVCVAVFLAMAALVWCVTAGPLAHLSWRWLTTLGALTYPLYLVHSQLGYAVIDELHDVVPGRLVLVIATALSVALAWLIHRCVERPFGPRLRAAVDRGLSRRTATAPA